MYRKILFACGISLLLFFTITGQNFELNVQTETDKTDYAPSDTIIAALKVKIPAQYHLYGNPLGPGIGKPMSLQMTNRNGVKWLFARKEPPKKFRPPVGSWVWAYEGTALFFITGVINPFVTANLSDTATIDGLICHQSCIPVTSFIPLSISIVPEKNAEKSFGNDIALQKEFFLAEPLQLDIASQNAMPSGTPAAGEGFLDVSGMKTSRLEEKNITWDYEPREKKLDYSIWLAVALAFCAGIILNVMPCVLPVLGIKVLSFSQSAGKSKRSALLRSLSFAAGMISVFLVLASFAAFAGLSWGEQFQDPRMLVAIVCVIFVFALGMFDVFMILVPSGVTNMERKSSGGRGYVDDFIKGIFTTILATPCSGPLLGATLAWTLIQKPLVIYTVFCAIGIGMAFPYVLLSASKTLMKLLPKPGLWMEDFKKFMGFLLFGFAVYLMIGLPADMILPTTGLCLFLAFGIMLFTRYAQFGSSFPRKVITGIAVICVIIAGWHICFNVMRDFVITVNDSSIEEKSGAWEEFTVDKLQNAHAEGRHVMVDFTANWCMNCQYNKVTVYHSKALMDLIREKNILTFKADLTQENPAAESLLHHLGSRSVPFLAIFPGDNPYEPIIMRDIVQKKDVLKTVNGLRAN
jgi:thiol:disulfide interchange protein